MRALVTAQLTADAQRELERDFGWTLTVERGALYGVALGQRLPTGLDQFEAAVKQDLDDLEPRLEALRAAAGLEIFPLNAAMLERSVSLATEKLDLKPYDNSILAAVLVRAHDLLAEGKRDLAFCELDSDLQPWDKYGNTKTTLARLYDEVHVWVYGDFTMTTPEPREGW